MPRAAVLSVLLLGLVVFGGCRRGTEPPGAPTRLAEASQPAATATVGTSLRDSLVVRVVDEKGRGVPRHSVRWAAAPGSGTVSPVEVVTDNRGYARTAWVLGTRAGSQVATASTITTEGAKAVQFTVAAQPGPVSTIFVSPSSFTLGVGQTRELAALRRDAYGNEVADRPVAWTSSDTTVASVHPQSGVVRGVGSGRATVATGRWRRPA